ncbi:MAG: M20/M25/M40 family metallo-hydrolase [Oscillospiraceae bacterium]|nr:M20/M25/M40 family metallo-hydrolase [Oscillospiraceae bacterium]
MNHGQNAYDFLRELSFPRTSGSDAEKRAAEMIAEQVKALGFTPVVEEFPVSQNRPVHGVFRLTDPEEVSYTVTGMVDAGETQGLDAEFYYLRFMDDISMQQARGKFVLLNSRPTEKQYRQMMEAGIVGFLLMNGTTRDTPETADLDTGRFRDAYTPYGKVPAFQIRMADAVDLLRRNPKSVHVELKLEEQQGISQNIIVEVPGTDFPDQILVAGAHYDSTQFSFGAWDNGAGVVHMLELLRHLKEHPPRRTVRVIFFGSEEVGLKGSGAYVEAHGEELPSILAMINSDVGGSYLGMDMIVSTGLADTEGYLNGLIHEAGYSARLSSGVMSSDSAVFSDYGIPSINLGQFPPEGANYMHTRYDNFARISPDVLGEEIRFLIFLTERLANSAVFPVPRIVPEDMRKKLIDYFGKERSHTAKQTQFPEEPEPRKPLF